jgi:hypothetical protein
VNQKYFILLFVLFLLSFSIPTSSAIENLNVEWIWEKELHQQEDNSLIIKVRNDNTQPITLKLIMIHYPWNAQNAFNILYLSEIIQPTSAVNIKFSVSVPYFAKVGETSDFACIIDYNINNSTETIGTDVIRCTKTIYAGNSIYISQTISPPFVYVISIFFIFSCFAINNSKEKIIATLEKYKRFIPITLFILTFTVYVVSLYMNFTPYMVTYSDLQGFSITGDEPHYIFATKGLLQGTTNITKFYPVNYSRHVVVSDGLLTKGQVIFSHMYGLPVMSIIPYKLGEIFLHSGTGGCLVFICMIVSLIILLIYKTSMFLSKNNIITSILTSLAFAFSTLLFVWSGQFFTEIVASFFVMLFITLIIASDNSRGWFFGGISLGILPFLKFQFIFISVLCVILGIILFIRNKKEIKYFIISCSILTIINILYMYLFIGFGAYNAGILILPQDLGIKTFNLFGLQINKLFYVIWLGLLLDRNVGVLFFGPILILSALGVFQLLKIKNVATYFAILICIFWGGSVSITTFWNGWIAPPGRYMIVLLPLLSLPFIMGITSFYKNKKYMYSFLFLFLCGLIPNTLMATNRLLDYVMSSAYGGGIIRFMEALAKLKIDIKIFPEFFDGMWSGQNIQYVYIWSIGFIIITGVLLYISYKYTKNWVGFNNIDQQGE